MRPLHAIRAAAAKGVSPTSAVLAWVILIAAIAAYVAAYDVWASKTGHRMMTTQFRIWLTETVMGPIIVGLWVGVFAALSYHFLIKGKG